MRGRIALLSTGGPQPHFNIERVKATVDAERIFLVTSEKITHLRPRWACWPHADGAPWHDPLSLENACQGFDCYQDVYRQMAPIFTVPYTKIRFL